MLVEYIHRALRKAKYEILEDGTFYGTVPGLRGVLANASTLEACRDELAEVIEGWVLVRVAHGLPIPPVDGVKVRVCKVKSKTVA
jgi:predicted RNase H-like HicB family nuclease